MFWKRASLRRVLLSALILLGGWGFVSSLHQVNQNWKEYKRSRNLAEWAHVAGQIMTMVQHLAFERGRTAVVLRGDNPVSDADRKFIEERRTLNDRAITEVQSRIVSLTDVRQEVFFDRWQQIQKLRQQVDRDIVLPLVQRDPTLVTRWVDQTTALLEQSGKLARELAQHYRQGEEASRLNLLGFLTLRLRMITGREATIIAQHVAANAMMAHEDIYPLYEMRGQQEAMWAEVLHSVDYLAIPPLSEMAKRTREQQQKALRPLQDNVLKSWVNKRPVTVKLNDLTAASPPVLDGISELMTFATQEASRVAHAKKDSARLVLVSHIILAASVLLVLLLAVYYVLAKVVKPLEAVDDTLRRINFPHDTSTFSHANAIMRLNETAQILTTVFAEKAQLEDELRELAFYDVLTQLPNRRLLLDRLQQKILRARRDHTQIALLFIDLDKFKNINDESGHEAGDWLLHAVAERIVACIRVSDTASRIGGDEFVVLLSDIFQLGDALDVAEKIRDAIAEPFAMSNGKWLQISASIGVAIFPDQADNEQVLMRVGDEAMFRAKSAGGNKVEMLP